MASTIYLSGPAIASLRASARMTENAHMRAGHYGPVLWHERGAYVALAAVERRMRLTFTPEQIQHAVAGQSHRVLVIAPTEDLPHDI
jgi:hypothetical protein